MSGFKTSYVYCIRAATGHVKVGISRNPDARLRQLQTGHPEALTMVWSEPVATKRAGSVERAIHQALSEKHLRGEWFTVTPDEAREAFAAANSARPGTKKPRRSRVAAAPTPVDDGEAFETDPYWIARARMTLEERREMWTSCELPDPPDGFDDWYVCGSPSTGPLGAFPIQYGRTPE